MCCSIGSSGLCQCMHLQFHSATHAFLKVLDVIVVQNLQYAPCKAAGDLCPG